MTSRLILTVRPSPIGPLALAFDDEARLRGVSFGEGLERTMRREYPGARFEEGDAPQEASALIDAYFAGDLSALGRVAWSLEGAAGGDGFNGRVWRLLAQVPTGVTLSYGETARRAGEPGAAQAAGVALNRNPIPLVLPCHRVVGADGAMVGFGGGLERKTWLLRHEGALLL
jgi:methylated-DNA-[protein]-cysteine S-methyltransferase